MPESIAAFGRDFAVMRQAVDKLTNPTLSPCDSINCPLTPITTHNIP